MSSRVGRVAVSMVGALLSSLPNDAVFSRMRVRYFRRRGLSIGADVTICRNVQLRGRITIGDRVSIADNCVLSSGPGSIEVGADSMIAPGCVVVAFEHGVGDLNRPMAQQEMTGADVTLAEDVWLGANSTVTAGVRVGRGAVVGAGAVVCRDVPAFAICVGVPARVVRYREGAEERKDRK